MPIIPNNGGHRQQGQKSIKIVRQKMKYDTSCPALPHPFSMSNQTISRENALWLGGDESGIPVRVRPRPRPSAPHLPFRHGFITSHRRLHSHMKFAIKEWGR